MFVFFTCSLKSGDFPFKYERLSVNFNGVASAGNTVLAYGDGSIVLRSTDKGIVWEQIQIASDEYEIMKMDFVYNQFFGILNSEYIVFSGDDGKTWSKKKIADSLSLYDFAVFSNQIYILTSNSIIILDS